MKDEEATGKIMGFDFDGGYERFYFKVPEGLFRRFQKTVHDEGQGTARVVNQFLAAYVLFLDSSFPKPGKKNPGPTRILQLRIPKVVYDRYKDKCRREGIGLRGPVLQFMSNYLALHENGSSEPVRERKKADS